MIVSSSSKKFECPVCGTTVGNDVLWIDNLKDVRVYYMVCDYACGTSWSVLIKQKDITKDYVWEEYKRIEGYYCSDRIVE